MTNGQIISMKSPEIDSYIIYCCPCCGADAMWCSANTPKGYMYWIKCTDCRLSTQPYLTKEEAQDVWNVRKGKRETNKKLLQQQELPF